ncbi:MAG TPA: nuclear transport factor 2 family protein [Steroidobacteraceae bacterium]
MDETNVWLAKLAIAELIIRYAALNDAGDWDGVAALYTDDGRMSRPTSPDHFIAGRAAILAAFRSRPLRATRHIISNVLVTVDSDTAAGASSQILLFTGASDGNGLPVQSTAPPLVGTYRDRLTRTNRGWRFVERRGTLDFRTATP